LKNFSYSKNVVNGGKKKGGISEWHERKNGFMGKHGPKTSTGPKDGATNSTLVGHSVEQSAINRAIN